MEAGHCRLPAPPGLSHHLQPAPSPRALEPPSRGSAILPQAGGGGGFQGPTKSGREGAERGHWLDFAPEGHCAKASQPFTWPNRKFTPKKTPCGNFKGCPAERALPSPFQTWATSSAGSFPTALLRLYLWGMPSGVGPGRSRAARGMRDTVPREARGVGGDGWVRGLWCSRHTGLEASCTLRAAGHRWERRAASGAPLGRPAHEVTYLVEASPEPTCPSWELSWAWSPSWAA